MDAYSLTFWHTGPLPATDAREDLFDEERILSGAAEDATIRIKLVDVLVSLRRRLKVSQRRVAQLMGTTQSAVSDMEKGLTDPRLSTLQRHARAIGCKINVEVVEEVWDAEAEIARSFIHYKSWLGTDSPTEQANITSNVDDAPARPWRQLLEEIYASHLSEQELTQQIKGTTSYRNPRVENFRVGPIEMRAS